jgi:hypothetical protein
METYLLYHLSKIVRSETAGIEASAVTMVFANRCSNDFISIELTKDLEVRLGKAILACLAESQ